MRRNRLRTFLTGFAVAWGIFMLIVLLGAGNGLQNGVQSNMANSAINTMFVSPGWRSMPYEGLRSDTRVRFDDRTVEYLRRTVPEIGYMTAYIFTRPRSVSFGDQYATPQVTGVLGEYTKIHYINMAQGRFVNDLDERTGRKVATLGKDTADVLFKNGEDPIGQYIMVDGIAFKVVGVCERPISGGRSSEVFIPLATARKLYDRGRGINGIQFTVNDVRTVDDALALADRIRAKMSPFSKFDPKDNSAVYIQNQARWSIEQQKVFGYVNIFLWVIGFASLMAGIVGVANIMLVTVKERTREIGIRKALGATPWSIIKSVIIEGVFITTVAGYLGILVGVGLTELVARVMGSAGAGNMTAFKDPTVGLGVVFAALGVLVISGMVAGLIPSLKATRIRPIEAMRAD